jgi:uncharacterized OB-fold protein
MDISQSFLVNTVGEVELRGSQCPECGHNAFPPRLTCPICGNRTPENVNLPGTGRVRTWARVELPPAGFDKPIVVAEVALDAGPMIFTLLTEEPGGERVRAVPHPVRDGAPGYAFQGVA